MANLRGMHFVSYVYQVTKVLKKMYTPAQKALQPGTKFFVEFRMDYSFDRTNLVYLYNLRTGSRQKMKLATWLKTRANLKLEMLKEDMNPIYERVTNDLIVTPTEYEDNESMEDLSVESEIQEEPVEESKERYIGDDEWLPKE